MTGVEKEHANLSNGNMNWLHKILQNIIFLKLKINQIKCN